MDSHQKELRAGLLYGFAAYLFWGIAPLYYKMVKAFPAIDILAHRVVWSVLLLALTIQLQRRWDEVRQIIRARRTLGMLVLSTILVSINWYVFIWAIGKGYVLEASLGYFITPLAQVILGMIFLKERLRLWQVVSFLLAATGVAYLAYRAGQAPWISLALAGSFSFYALVRKVALVGPLVGLSVETGLMLPWAVWIVWRGVEDDMTTPGGPTWAEYAWLPLAGVVTALPLLWFARAAKVLKLSTMGFLQYIAPTGQLLLAVFVFGEAFRPEHRTAFACIWMALVIYSVESVAFRRASNRKVEAPLEVEAVPEA